MASSNKGVCLSRLTPDEIRVEKAKAKKRGDKACLKELNEEMWDEKEKRIDKADTEYEENLEDEEKIEGEVEGLPKGEKAEDVYDSEEVEELLEDDEIEEQEAGFMEGYDKDEEGSKKKKKK
ncbi:MAG: hypothetical protein AABY09_06095 [Nanoarchaeota archaeon]